MMKTKRALCLLFMCVCVMVCGFCITACSCSFVTEKGYVEGSYAVVSAFSKIEIDADGGVNLAISYGAEFSVDYTESDQEKFSFDESEGTLVVKQRKIVHSNLIHYKSKTLNIVVPVENKITTLFLNIDGATDCNLIGEFGEIRFDVDGALHAEMNGNAENLYVDCNGAVEIGTRDFVVNTATLDCNGAMTFELTCNVSLKVDCNGTCTGVYYGDCTIEKNISGIGSVKKGQVEEE